MIIETTKGPMNEEDLEKAEGWIDNDNEFTTWVEYWYNDELVYKSTQTIQKKPDYL